MVEIGDILVLVCASGRAVRLSGPILISAVLRLLREDINEIVVTAREALEQIEL
jgi:hypothetical protein